MNKSLFYKKIPSVTQIVMTTIFLGMHSIVMAGSDFSPCFDCGHSGFYIGGKVGYARMHWHKIISSRFQQDTGFAGGVNLGYAFNPYFSLEVGATHLPSRVKSFIIKDNKEVGFVKNYAFDFSGKISTHLTCWGFEKIGVYAKAGVSYLRSKSIGEFGRVASAAGLGVGKRNTNLTYGFGATWHFLPRFVADMSFQRWQGNAKKTSHNHQPYMDAYMLGVTYLFGDV